MLTDLERKFFEENKERIFDLIRAVDQHEHIRSVVGAGLVSNHPHLLPDYERCHDIMSRLSYFLAVHPNLGPIDNHPDLPERPSWDSTVGASC